MTSHAIANWFAISRIVLIPVLVVSIVRSWTGGSYLTFARVIFIYGMISDILDGRIVSRTNRDNPIGRFLDPLADKLGLGAAYITLSLAWHNPPLWLTAIVVGRFVLLRSLWLIPFLRSGQKLMYYLKQNSILTRPNLLGKASSWSQAILVILVLFSFPQSLLVPIYFIVASLTVAAGGTYLILGIREAGSLT